MKRKPDPLATITTENRIGLAEDDEAGAMRVASFLVHGLQ